MNVNLWRGKVEIYIFSLKVVELWVVLLMIRGRQYTFNHLGLVRIGIIIFMVVAAEMISLFCFVCGAER